MPTMSRKAEGLAAGAPLLRVPVPGDGVRDRRFLPWGVGIDFRAMECRFPVTIEARPVCPAIPSALRPLEPLRINKVKNEPRGGQLHCPAGPFRDKRHPRSRGPREGT